MVLAPMNWAALAGLVAGVGNDVALRRPGEGQYRAMEWVARPGKRHHMVMR